MRKQFIIDGLYVRKGEPARYTGSLKNCIAFIEENEDGWTTTEDPIIIKDIKGNTYAIRDWWYCCDSEGVFKLPREWEFIN